ncbi:MAG: hypothetical protein HYS98_07315, partial [Deltaproteobacteria bacterium]|nr:hypothetical protein [Deltaproteobacteria bacterium]
LAKANPKKFRILSEPLKTDFSSSPFHNPLAIQNSNFPSGNLTVGMGDSGDIAQIKRKLEEAIAKIREFIIDKLQGYFPEMTDEDGITWITLPYGTTQFAGAWGITS